MSENEENGYGLNRLVKFECIRFSDNYPEDPKVGDTVTAYELQYQYDY